MSVATERSSALEGDTGFDALVAARGWHGGLLEPPTLTTLPAAIGANVASIRGRTRAPIMAVVKADGYGHGATTVARAAVAAGATWLGTTDVAGGCALRAAGFRQPILAWLHPSGIDAAAAVAHRVDVALGVVDELRSVLRRPGSNDSPVRLHLHLDTGMARAGCPAREWPALLERAVRAQAGGAVRVVGLMGHLARADEGCPEANAAAVAQLRAARRAVLAAGLGRPLTHLAATSAALCDPATHFDLVRIGAGLVGIDPSGTTELQGASWLNAPVVHCALVPAGTPVGYGGTAVTDRSTHLCVLPLGYADGIPRELQPGAAVEIAGRRHPLVGRVSMDQLVVDAGDLAVPRGTTATVFGPGSGTVPTVHDWARWAGTIPHTIVTGIGPRIRRQVA